MTDKEIISQKTGWNEKIILRYRPRCCRPFCSEDEERNKEEHIKEYSIIRWLTVVLYLASEGKWWWQDIVVQDILAVKEERLITGDICVVLVTGLCLQFYYPHITLSNPGCKCPPGRVMNKTVQVLRLNESLYSVLQNGIWCPQSQVTFQSVFSAFHSTG